MDPRVAAVEIEREGGRVEDLLAVEEPLEIRVVYFDDGDLREEAVSITMRTPGNDWELALGFLHGEGLLPDASLLASRRPLLPERPGCNSVRVNYAKGAAFDPSSLKRHFYTTSSCGVCGKASLDALRANLGDVQLDPGRPKVDRSVIASLPDKLRGAQAVFERTGGLHAAGVFSAAGELALSREDVGRHNAVDKAVGRLLLEDRLPASDCILMVSGRTSFEILQKALAAGIPIVAAVSAPSSLAVELAQEFNLTLCGFVRGQTFNTYHDPGRLTG
ncbi:MAG TPA: formate dehydrogenase accessory sulfurtransferase FdhD [Acidobacteriota bacterium]|nr:formate dehydrogenase accessory sulfurtransferase FdhD [Acidobacteriota bacterium]